jgi:hypothetical protein
MNAVLEKIKGIEISDGKTLDDILGAIVEHSLEERNEALQTFRDFRSMVVDQEDLFVNGDKPSLYLKIAQESTDTLIRLVTAVQKIVEDNKEKETEDVNIKDILKNLDDQGIAPERFAKNTIKVISNSE